MVLVGADDGCYNDKLPECHIKTDVFLFSTKPEPMFTPLITNTIFCGLAATQRSFQVTLGKCFWAWKLLKSGLHCF